LWLPCVRGNEADIPEFYDPNDEAEILNSLPLHSAVVPTLTRLSTTCNDIQAAFDQAGVDAVMVGCTWRLWRCLVVLAVVHLVL
jgi:hypothetical protein